MISYLKNVFSDVPTLVLSATITLTVLEYIRESLKLCPVTRLYRKSLEKANITYMVLEIVKPNFENLGFFIPNSGGTGSIPKKMIFVDSIDEAQRIAAYLCIRLLSRLQGRKEEIIHIFSLNLKLFT